MTRALFDFAGFTLDVATRELRRGAARVSVSPRSFDVIAYLVRHRDRAVGRDELVSAVWGKTSVTDTVLGKTILGARRALEDSVEAPRFIRTVSRFGYHWIAAVSESVEEAADEPVAPAPAPESPILPMLPASANSPPPSSPRPTARLRGLLFALLAIVLLVAVGAAMRHFAAPSARDRERDAAVAAASAPSSTQTQGWLAAVIPASVSAREEDAWLRLGLMDLIAVRLRGAGIATMPSDALLRLVHPGTDADEAARVLRETAGVQQVIVPSVRRDGANWAVKLALLRPEGVTLEVEETAIDAIRAAHAAVDRLLQRLGRAPQARTGVSDQLSLEELLQRLEAARLSDDLAGARRLIEQAPPTIAARPDVRLRQAQFDLRAGRLDEALRTLDDLLGSVSAEAAPALRAQVLYARGTALLLGTHYEQARAAYDQGVALLERHVEPDIAARLYMGRGNLAALQGQYEAAAADHARARVAFQLAGDSFTTFWLDGNEGALQNHLGRPAAALPLLLRAEQHFERYNVFNELATTRANEVVSYLMLVQPADALAASERALPVLDRVADASLHRLVLLRRAMALAAVGRSGEARTLLHDLLAAADPRNEASVRGSAHAVLADIELASGHTDAAAGQARTAVDALTGPQDVRMRAAAWLTETRALRALGRSEQASTRTQALLDWSVQMHRPFATFVATLAAAEQAA
ncbi:MAG: winged helix-turn-helix domain-containing protein, partial [Dokdonella sp.]